MIFCRTTIRSKARSVSNEPVDRGVGWPPRFRGRVNTLGIGLLASGVDRRRALFLTKRTVFGCGGSDDHQRALYADHYRDGFCRRHPRKVRLASRCRERKSQTHLVVSGVSQDSLIEIADLNLDPSVSTCDRPPEPFIFAVKAPPEIRPRSWRLCELARWSTSAAAAAQVWGGRARLEAAALGNPVSRG